MKRNLPYVHGLKRLSRFIVLLLLPVSLNATAGNDFCKESVGDSLHLIRRQGWVFEINGLAGKQIKIYPNYPAVGISGFGEVYAGYQCFGTKAWHQSWKFPQIGVSLLYGWLGNEKILGQSIGIVPGITLMSRDDRRVKTDVRLGTGLSWFNRPYDRFQNKENLIIGSHVTNVTFVNVYFRQKISQKFWIYEGLSFIHYSNGHYQLPNVGMNTLTVDVGLKFYPYGKPGLVCKRDTLAVIDHRVKANIRIGFGVNEFGSATKPLGGPKYPVYVMNLYASKRFGKISNLHAGVFITYYSSFYDYIVNNHFYDQGGRMKSMVISPFIGYEMMIGRFGILWQSGLNVYNPFQKEYFKINYGNSTSAQLKRWWCNKVGAQIYLLRTDRIRRCNVWLGAYIKSNLMTADFVETAVGFSL